MLVTHLLNTRQPDAKLAQLWTPSGLDVRVKCVNDGETTRTAGVIRAQGGRRGSCHGRRGRGRVRDGRLLIFLVILDPLKEDDREFLQVSGVPEQ
jgi:hypothetical protein